MLLWMEWVRVGEYEIAIKRSRCEVTVIAATLGGRPGVRSRSAFERISSGVCNINGIRDALLEPREIESHKFEDSWFDFPTVRRATAVYELACAWFADTKNHAHIVRALDADRSAGEWEER